MINLSIIIPTWNTANITLQCVRSLKKYLKNFPLEIIVVDNASADDTVTKLKKEQGIVIIKNKKNFSFDKASNIGDKKATCYSFSIRLWLAQLLNYQYLKITKIVYGLI